MIIVTGASGQLGQRIIHELLGKLPAAELGVSVRDPSKAAGLAARGVRVRQGDYAQPASLTEAFAGATQLLLVSSNVAAQGGDPLAQHRAAIDAAKAAGVRRIVYTSQVSASPTSLFPPGRDHAATEAMLRASGLQWTSLRNGFYASTLGFLLRGALATGVIETPPAGPVAWTTHDDLAAAAAAILVDEGRFDGPTPPLTASHAFDFDALCAAASETLRRPLRHQLISEETLRGQLQAMHLPPGVVTLQLGLYRAAHANEFAAVDPTLAQLIGRPPTALRDALAALLPPA